MRRALLLFCACGLFYGLVATTPARALIEKIMNQCSGKLCPFFRTGCDSDGWVKGGGATRYFNSQFLLPKGADFEKGGGKDLCCCKN